MAIFVLLFARPLHFFHWEAISAATMAAWQFEKHCQASIRTTLPKSPKADCRDVFRTLDEMITVGHSQISDVFLTSLSTFTLPRNFSGKSRTKTRVPFRIVRFGPGSSFFDHWTLKPKLWMRALFVARSNHGQMAKPFVPLKQTAISWLNPCLWGSVYVPCLGSVTLKTVSCLSTPGHWLSTLMHVSHTRRRYPIIIITKAILLPKEVLHSPRPSGIGLYKRDYPVFTVEASKKCQRACQSACRRLRTTHFYHGLITWSNIGR